MIRFLAFLTTVTWKDIVDIVFISYLLWRAYILFQGTNAFRVLVGIISLLILQELTDSIGLILTSWAIQGITFSAAIIIIVVFRNEIRSIFQVRNLKQFLWGVPRSEQTTPVEIIAESVYQMGKKRIGALLVFPGKEDLSEVIHGGIRWNGTVSQEMLLSIFWPKNPVHDGAAIVRGDSIVEVAVLLPLSQRQDLPSYYGTRHRAAAGLAERTDALVLVVSEERGRVTAAKDNWIKPIAQAEELVHLLKDHMGISDAVPAQQQKRERLRLAISAAVSLLIVTGVWFGLTRSQDTIITTSAPIEYINRPVNFEILETSVDEARLQLYGSSALVRSLRPGQVQVRVDLGKAVEGHNAFPLTQDSIVLPPGVSLSKIDPPSIDVTLDVPLTKELPIQVDWTGRLPDNLVLTRATVVPDSVKVIGGSKILEKVGTIYTAPIRLDNLMKSGSLSGSLVLTPPSLKPTSLSSDRVTIYYVLEDRSTSERK